MKTRYRFLISVFVGLMSTLLFSFITLLFDYANPALGGLILVISARVTFINLKQKKKL